MKNTLNRRWIAGPLIVGLTTVGAMGVLQAQPDANDVGKGENPTARQRGGRQGGNREGGKHANMTPEQREAARAQMQQQMQQRRETNLRTTLTNAGFADKGVQDAVIAFVNEQNGQERNDTRAKMRQLNQAVRNNANDQEIAGLLAAIRAETEASKVQHEAALKELDAKIGYTTKPRLEAVLTLAGVTGENFGGGKAAFGGGAGRGGQGQAGAGRGQRNADGPNRDA